MLHWLVDAPVRDTEYAIPALREALAGIAATGVAVKPVSEVWAELATGAGPAAARR